MNNNYLSIIIPTLNEEGNIDLLIENIYKQKNSNKWEIIFVDDNSSDGTIDKIIKNSKTFPNINYIKRYNNRSLSLSCTEGFKKATCDHILVMDADLQHNPIYINTLHDKIINDGVDIVIASRFLDKNSKINFSYFRKKISLAAVTLVNMIVDIKVTDPLSGYFIVDKVFLLKVINKLDNKGFKILLEIIIKSYVNPKISEIPIDFNKRVSGHSKLSLSVIIDFFKILLIKIKN